MNHLLLLLIFLISCGCTAGVFMKNNYTAEIEITEIPSYGSMQKISGIVHNHDSSVHALAGYYFISGLGWKNIIVDGSYFITIKDDSFSVFPAVEEENKFITRIAFFLIDKSFPITSAPFACLPDELFDNAAAFKDVRITPPQIFFSNFTWDIKTSFGRVGPKENFFSGSDKNIWTDDSGNLHLKITKNNDHWKSAEVYLSESLGCGEYTWEIETDLSKINENIVFGIFTWDDDECTNYNNEIDFEFSRWGNRDSDFNAQYVVHPEKINRFKIEEVKPTTHTLLWEEDKITFTSFEKASGRLINSWTLSGKIPSPKNEKIRINLWLFNENAVSEEEEVVIKSFRFSPR